MLSIETQKIIVSKSFSKPIFEVNNPFVKQERKTSMVHFAWALVATLSLSLSAYADSKIYIHNDNDKPISLSVITKGNEGVRIIKEVPAKSRTELALETSDFRGANTYNIDGETHPFIGDKCKNLQSNQDYVITFTNDTIVTTCHAEKR